MALDPPERYLSEILRYNLRLAIDRVIAVWPVVAFPVVTFAAVIPRMVATDDANVVPPPPLPPGPHDMLAASAHGAPPLFVLSPRTVIFAAIWVAWAAWLAWSWPRIHRAARLVSTSLSSSSPAPVRLATAFGPGDTVYLPLPEVQQWAKMRIDELNVPMDRHGDAVIPNDGAVSQTLMDRVVAPISPVTALDHGRVRLASHIAARLTRPSSWGRASARFLAYAMLVPGPSRTSEEAVDCAALSFADPKLIRRDLEHINRFHGGRPHAPRTPEVIAMLLRVHQPFLAKTVIQEQGRQT
jgi:hypothetical protein